MSGRPSHLRNKEIVIDDGDDTMIYKRISDRRRSVNLWGRLVGHRCYLEFKKKL